MSLVAQPEPAPRLSRGGWWLLGAAATVFALSLAAATAAPGWQAARRVHRAKATLAELQKFEKLFQGYAHDHGDWPASAAPASAPEGMQPGLLAAGWDRRTPLGGRYAWLISTTQRGQRVAAAITIVSVPGDAVSDDQRQLRALLDQAGSDRNIATRLRLGFRSEPVYVLEN